MPLLFGPFFFHRTSGRPEKLQAVDFSLPGTMPYARFLIFVAHQNPLIL